MSIHWHKDTPSGLLSELVATPTLSPLMASMARCTTSTFVPHPPVTLLSCRSKALQSRDKKTAEEAHDIEHHHQQQQKRQ